MGYATSGVKMLKVREKAGGPAIAPSVEATQKKAYPIARSLLVYTLGEPQGAAKKYIEWILGDAGQKIVGQTGYVPIFASERAK
jgi:phosphate transport system substrate-binding protein